jgi:hypothetical protein
MKIVAAISRRYEPDSLIEELHKNLHWVDEIICYNDSKRDPKDTDWREHQRYTQLHEWAGQSNADYVIATAPDERLSQNSEEIIRTALEQDKKRETFFCIPALELYTPTQYRSDGDWGTSFQCRIYPWKEDQEFTNLPLHNLCVPIHKGEHEKLIPAYAYHLKHIEKENIIKRIESFEEIDPEGKLSLYGEGYRYLADEEGIELTQIQEDEMYYPPYTQPYIFNPGEK